MDSFTNELIDTTVLPQFEKVVFTKLHSKYVVVVLINQFVVALVFVLAPLLLSYTQPKLLTPRIWLILGFLISFFILCGFTFSLIGFKKKGFAFREHDVLYQSGAIATNTIVIPYNRVQHVAMHEGLLSRWLGLAKIEIFTAGGSSSDLKIAGIPKIQAENIKQLLMGKIQKQL